MSLGERLKLLRSEKDITQLDIAKHLKIERSTYGKYETGDSSPDYEKLLKLAQYFDVSTDYLLGKEKDRNPYKDINSIIAAHRTDGYDEDLPDDAKEELETYIEFLKHKYKKGLESKGATVWILHHYELIRWRYYAMKPLQKGLI